METIKAQTNQNDTYDGAGPLVGIGLAISIGILAAVAVLPSWAPNLAATLIGSSPKAYWYLSRGLAFVALALLWISMALGLLITDKLSRTWPGAAAAFAIHEYVSLLGVAFAGFHALVLLGDRYIGYTPADILVPFASAKYQPFWIGLGQVGLYVWVLVAGSFYVRRRIGPTTWKLIHAASFFTFLVALMHGLAAGTDTGSFWAQAGYWFMGGSLLFLTAYRIAASIAGPENRAPAPTTAPRLPES